MFTEFSQQDNMGLNTCPFGLTQLEKNQLLTPCSILLFICMASDGKQVSKVSYNGKE